MNTLGGTVTVIKQFFQFLPQNLLPKLQRNNALTDEFTSGHTDTRTEPRVDSLHSLNL